MFKLLLVLAAWGVSLGDASARRGYVRTRDGRVFEGHMRFETNAVIIADAAKLLRAEVALTNIAALGFETEAESPTASLPGAPMRLLPPWQNVDVGSARETGEAEFRNGMWRVRSTGTNVQGSEDSFHFAYKPVSGSSELVARVLRAPGTDPWARAGVMMREGLAADARHVFLSVTAARGGLLASRERKGGETTMALDRMMGGSVWLKLKRDGEYITALKSIDGRRWSIVEKLKMPMDEELYAGLAVVGVRDTTLGEGLFERVEEGASLRNRAYVPQVELKSGSLQAGYVERMDDTAVYFDPMERRTPISTRGVALVRFQPVPPKLAPRVSEGRQGVLLVSGEFIEGTCGGIENHRVTIQSVPLGIKRYDVNSEIIAIVLGNRAVAPQRPFEVTTTDGATWVALGVTLDPQGLILRESFLGTRRIYLHEIAEVRRGS